MKRKKELSKCEITTMKCIWDIDHPVTCAEVMERLQNNYGLEYKDTTVYTFLKNLKEKGFVDSYRKGLTYYVPLCTEEEYRNEMLKQQKKFWFGNSAVQMVSAMFQAEQLSDQEREELKRLIDEWNQ